MWRFLIWAQGVALLSLSACDQAVPTADGQADSQRVRVVVPANSTDEANNTADQNAEGTPDFLKSELSAATSCSGRAKEILAGADRCTTDEECTVNSCLLGVCGATFNRAVHSSMQLSMAYSNYAVNGETCQDQCMVMTCMPFDPSRVRCHKDENQDVGTCKIY